MEDRDAHGLLAAQRVVHRNRYRPFAVGQSRSCPTKTATSRGVLAAGTSFSARWADTSAVRTTARGSCVQPQTDGTLPGLEAAHGHGMPVLVDTSGPMPGK